VRLGQCTPAAADGIEHPIAERRAKTLLQHRGRSGRLASGRPSRSIASTGKAAERQTDPTIADIDRERLGDFEAAAAHVADRPKHGAEKAEITPSAAKRGFLRSAERYEPQDRIPAAMAAAEPPVRSTRRRIRFVPVAIDLYHAIASAMARNRRTASTVRRKPLRRDNTPRLLEAFAEATQRLLV